MRIWLISLLALLPLMGLPLSAATCGCDHAESAEAELVTVSCCQSMPECCVQTETDPAPKTPIYLLVTQSDSFGLTLFAVETLTEERALRRPQVGAICQRARPPPLLPSEQRCHLQSWLI